MSALGNGGSYDICGCKECVADGRKVVTIYYDEEANKIHLRGYFDGQWTSIPKQTKHWSAYKLIGKYKEE